MNRKGSLAAAVTTRRRVVTLPGRGSTVIWEAPGPPGAPVLFLLHGATLNAELNWSGAIDVLGRHYRVVAPDLRGHGDGLRCSVFRLEDCADDVAALATELDIDRFAAVGYSMGGFVAQLLWRRHRERVTGLVLCSTARNMCGSPWERSIAMLLPSAVATAAWFPALYPLGADLIAAGLLDRDLGPAERSWALAQMRRTTLRDALSTVQSVSAFTSHDWIGSVDVPAAAVLTRHDRVVPVRRQWKLARAIPGSTVIEVDGDHGVFVSSPGRFAAAVLAGCDAVRAGTDLLATEPTITAS
ncbi:alpha/beta fold hydrolase [Pseudonocardia sp. H11422]|uniref:alpha/beta fold hydrolase n=1 Tax=Pseudonocardia sp. H11422 TaxID=2835866 RepID=UPI001BDBD441|nr:alpha/beta hydrolase [Pseudonocardia sp. H11422]